jgi:hypothetical protein
MFVAAANNGLDVLSRGYDLSSAAASDDVMSSITDVVFRAQRPTDTLMSPGPKGDSLKDLGALGRERPRLAALRAGVIGSVVMRRAWFTGLRDVLPVSDVDQFARLEDQLEIL